MSTGMNISTFASKSHDNPDEARSPRKTRVKVVRLPGFTLGRFSSSRAGDGRNASNPLSALKAARSATLATWYPAASRSD
jgi:hypothetical protein